MDLNSKVAWVVGGSSGIGAAVARELLHRGATVAISARRQEQLQDVARGDMLVLPADVTDVASVAAAAARIRDELGPIDLAVLAAGYWQPMNPQHWDTDVFDRHVQVNLTGMSNAIAALLPEMLRRRSGVIAGVSSVAGYRGLAGAEAYGATKAAQLNLLEALRIHLARTGVRITTVSPASCGPTSQPATASRCRSSSTPTRPHGRSATVSSAIAPRSSSPRGWPC